MDIKLIPEKYKRTEESAGESKLPTVGFSRLSSQLTAKANLWLVLSLSLLIMVILACFGLWGYQNSLIKEKETLESRITKLESQRDLELEANFMELKKGIENFKKILKIHIYPSQLFKMLEELTLPQVQFTDFSADLSQAKISLKVEAINYNTLAKQIVVFGGDSRIKKIELSEVSLDAAGRAGSNLEIELEPSFLRLE
jgi:hypothetical protein